MNWFKYDTADQFHSFELVINDDDAVVDLHYQQKSVAKRWQPLAIAGVRGTPRRIGDFPTLNNYAKIPIFSERAWQTLQPLLGDCCEALPLIHPRGKTFFLINVMKIVDCLDQERSEYTRNSVNGRINRVFEYAFKEELLRNHRIFKTPLSCGAELFVSETVKVAIEKEKLQGLRFEPLPLKQNS